MKQCAIGIIVVLLLICNACGTNSKKNNVPDKQTVKVKAPEFDADSAYQFIKMQVDFGPRVPNSKEHAACGNYLANKLAAYGAKVISQQADLTAYNGTRLKARNIIGSYKPESKKRIALFAHWDTRPWADNDKNKTNHHTPILGANDGASGVGVLLEIARQIQQKQPEMGVDIIFFDAEDYGTPQFETNNHDESYWCLGSQYWAQNPHVEGYNARFGILLDMVGGKGATFYKEKYSEKFASSVVKKVWETAETGGFGNYFINENGGYITDDHLFVNRIAQIPTIDIVPFDQKSEQSFGDFWHTLDDNMNVIDRSTLNAVGQTVMNVIYNEK